MIFLTVYLINAVTDLLAGYVYTLPSIVMVLVSMFNPGEGALMVGIAAGTILLLIFRYDREEKYLGHGDYLIILSHAVNRGILLKYDMVMISACALIYCIMTERRRIPFVPFLFVGLLISQLMVDL